MAWFVHRGYLEAGSAYGIQSVNSHKHHPRRRQLVAVSVLIVDDSPFARKVIRHHLEEYGCQVVGEAENGLQAIKLFKELKPQLVTLDVMMPEVGGVDSLTAFRAMGGGDR